MGDAAVGAYELRMQARQTGTGLLEITLRRATIGSIRSALRARTTRSGQRRLDDDGDHDNRKRIVRTDAVEEAGQVHDRTVPIIFPRMRPAQVTNRLLLVTSRTSLPGDASTAARMASS